MALVRYLTTNNKPIRLELYSCYDIVWLFVCLLIATSALDLRTCFLFCKIYSIGGLKSILETRRLFAAARRLFSAFDRKSGTKLNIFYIVLSSIWITWNSFWVFWVCLLSYNKIIREFDRLPILGDGDRKAGDGDPKTRIKGDKPYLFIYNI